MCKKWDDKDMKDTQELVATLRRLADYANISFAELARETGIDRAKISRFLRKKTSARIITAQRIAEALGYRIRIKPNQLQKSNNHHSNNLPELNAHLIGEIRAEMKRQRISQKALSSRTGISQGRLSEILNGRRVMSLKTFERIAAALDCNIEIEAKH